MLNASILGSHVSSIFDTSLLPAATKRHFPSLDNLLLTRTLPILGTPPEEMGESHRRRVRGTELNLMKTQVINVALD